MIGFYISIGSILTFLMIENFLRFSKDAKSLKISESDKGTTALLRFALISTITLVLCSYFLNIYNILRFNNRVLFFMGLIFVIIGIVIRLIATFTLKEYYTRTLKITDKHKVIKHGIYSIVRHPGYLGVTTFLIGSGLLTGNLITIILIVIIVPFSFIKRLLIEEQMLLENFGDEYKGYMKKTYRLIPFIF
jgi:protein-S-isoprenylcysteine O-methyltransferase Ste14